MQDGVPIRHHHFSAEANVYIGRNAVIDKRLTEKPIIVGFRVKETGENEFSIGLDHPCVGGIGFLPPTRYAADFVTLDNHDGVPYGRAPIAVNEGATFNHQRCRLLGQCSWEVVTNPEEQNKKKAQDVVAEFLSHVFPRHSRVWCLWRSLILRHTVWITCLGLREQHREATGYIWPAVKLSKSSREYRSPVNSTQDGIC